MNELVRMLAWIGLVSAMVGGLMLMAVVVDSGLHVPQPIGPIVFGIPYGWLCAHVIFSLSRP